MVFKTKADLKRHYEDNLWESCVQKTGTKFVCQICKRKLDSVKEFKRHWDPEHDDEAIGLNFLRSVGKKGKKGNWTMRPIERELIINRLRSDKSKKALKYDYIANHLVKEEFEYGVNRFAMTVVEILGIPEIGKSMFALTCARHLQTLWRERLDALWEWSPEAFGKITESYDEEGNPKYYRPQIRIGFNMQQTSVHIQAARMGDVVIQDEDPEMAGYESKTTRDKITNILEIMRKACVNLIFVSPLPVSYLKIPTMVFEVVAKDVDNRVSAAALYDRQHNALGWVLLEVLSAEDPLVIFYEKEKDKNIENIKREGGQESVMMDENALRRDVKRLYDFLIEFGIDPRKERLSKPTLQRLAGLAGIKGSTTYIKLLAWALHRSLKLPEEFVFVEEGYLPPAEPDKIVTSDDEFIIELEEVIEDPDILETIYESAPEAYETKIGRGEQPPRKLHVEYMRTMDEEGNSLQRFFSKHAEAWMLVYVKGYTMQATADALAQYSEDGTLTDAAIANAYTNGGWRAIFQEELAGEAAEIAVKKRMFLDDEWENVGGYGYPDIINTVDDTWVEVKLRSRLRPKEPVESQIADFEYEHVRQGKPLLLVRIGYVPRKARIEVWSVKINPDWLEEGIDKELAEESGVEEKEK